MTRRGRTGPVGSTRLRMSRMAPGGSNKSESPVRRAYPGALSTTTETGTPPTPVIGPTNYYEQRNGIVDQPATVTLMSIGSGYGVGGLEACVMLTYATGVSFPAGSGWRMLGTHSMPNSTYLYVGVRDHTTFPMTSSWSLDWTGAGSGPSIIDGAFVDVILYRLASDADVIDHTWDYRVAFGTTTLPATPAIPATWDYAFHDAVFTGTSIFSDGSIVTNSHGGRAYIGASDTGTPNVSWFMPADRTVDKLSPDYEIPGIDALGKQWRPDMSIALDYGRSWHGTESPGCAHVLLGVIAP